ncbi:hypothetical protein CRG98_035148 [Punica granatum]|uniref:CCHC-type domain-containing protein n=1 Tax=Punica granatum TaxID=22663 RepID=A0A2I0IKE2_PUNGR|nr:hypothetical protein CRG98_035148 [Punica granatum]
MHGALSDVDAHPLVQPKNTVPKPSFSGHGFNHVPPYPPDAPDIPKAPQDANSQTYLSKLVGHISGAYESVFCLERGLQDDDSNDDVEDMDSSNEGQLHILLTRDEKRSLRQPWRSSLIIKLFGKFFELHYFTQRLKSLWYPSGRQFLTTRLWEPCFRPSKATFSAVAIWVRLLELPIEFYTEKLLSKIGNRIGPLLRIDSRTYLKVRGKYARLCVQVDLMRPLPTTLWIGDFEQPLQYEGIDQLCFNCGIVGHTFSTCPDLVPTPPSSPLPTAQVDALPISTEDPAYGPWLMVQNRRKRTPNTISRNSRTQPSLAPTSHSPVAATPSRNPVITNDPTFPDNPTTTTAAPGKGMMMTMVGMLPHSVSRPATVGSSRHNQHRLPRQHASNGHNRAPVPPIENIPNSSFTPMQCTDEGYVKVLVQSLPQSTSVRSQLPIPHTDVQNLLEANLPQHAGQKVNRGKRPQGLPQNDAWMGIRWIRPRDVGADHPSRTVEYMLQVTTPAHCFLHYNAPRLWRSTLQSKIISDLHCPHQRRNSTLLQQSTRQVHQTPSTPTIRRMINVPVTTATASTEEVHAIAQVSHPISSPWLLFTIYASPRPREREILWENLCKVSQSMNMPWVAVGDFNEVASSIDKIGGRAVNVNRMSTFNTMLDTCSLTDLGYTGPRHTWTNLHSSLSLIMERLNRAVANPTWHLLFPEASVHHLPHIHSDHCPLLLKLNPAMETTPNRPFRFESKWLSHIGFKKLVLQSWEQANFDHN